MELYEYPSQSLSSSSSSPSILYNFAQRIQDTSNLTFCAVLRNLFFAIFTFCFAFVGFLLGAMTGAFFGQETDGGLIRGTVIGAVSGAVFSLEVFESSVILWRSDESRIVCLLFLIEVIAKLLSGRLVPERIGPAILSAVQSQMGEIESIFEEGLNTFNTEGVKGLACDLVERIPKIKITTNNNADSTGRKFLARCACRTSRLKKWFDVCLIVTICFIFLALTNGFLDMDLAPYAEETSI